VAKFAIFTWGRCQYGRVEIIHPTKLDLRGITTRRGEHEVEIPGIGRIRYENRDSSKNLHRDVEITDVYVQFIVIRYYGARSCSKGFDEVYLVKKVDGQVVVERLEQKEELVTAEDGKYRITLTRTYVEVGGQKVIVAEHEIRREVCADKLTVRIKASNGKTYVNGDTYHIRDRLKQMRYRWDPERKMWYKDADISVVKRELESIGVRVVVE
jgi:hypothetical protein